MQHQAVRLQAARLDRAGAGVYKAPLSGQPCPNAQVAQLVEQRTENPCVAGSIPALGTILLKELRDL